MAERPSRSKAATFVTGTPFPLVSKRSALEEISPNSVNTRSATKSIKNEKTELYPNRKNVAQTSTISATPKPSHYNAKRHKIEEDLNSLANESLHTCQPVDQPKNGNPKDKENCENYSPSQYIAMDLVKACCIM